MDLSLTPPLRLGLVFFNQVEARAVRGIVNWLASEQLPWIVVDERPFHAILMSRGPRRGDDQNLAVFRLASDARAAAVLAHGDAMPQMALRKPLEPMHLRIVLEMAAASLVPDYVASVSPHTQPRAPWHATNSRPATLA